MINLIIRKTSSWLSDCINLRLLVNVDVTHEPDQSSMASGATQNII